MASPDDEFNLVIIDCVFFDVTGSWELSQDVTVTASYSLDLSFTTLVSIATEISEHPKKSHSHNAVL